MTCPQCGAALDPADAFCRKCGHELGAQVVEDRLSEGPIQVTIRKVTRVACGKCGKAVPVGEKKCPSCGQAIPSLEEIQAKFASAQAGSGAVTTAASGTMKCPHCGTPLKLRNGYCVSCGQKVELPEFVRKALGNLSGGGLHLGLNISSPSRLRSGTRVKISLSTAGFLAGALGLLLLLTARPPFSFRGPFTSAHISALVVLGVGMIMVIVGKLSSSE